MRCSWRGYFRVALAEVYCTCVYYKYVGPGVEVCFLYALDAKIGVVSCQSGRKWVDFTSLW